MVRGKLFFKGFEDFEFPSNYDDYLSSLLFKCIKKFIKKSDFKDYKFYTFSNFEIEQIKPSDDGLISLDGVISVVISSVDEDFLRGLVAFIVEEGSLYFMGNNLDLFKFSLSDISINSGSCEFITVSPLFLKHRREDEDIYDYLSGKLVESYCECYNMDNTDLSCEIKSHEDIFQVIEDGEVEDDFKDYYYMMNLFIKGDKELISFAYEAGLGDDTHKGFGMLDLY